MQVLSYPMFAGIYFNYQQWDGGLSQAPARLSWEQVLIPGPVTWQSTALPTELTWHVVKHKNKNSSDMCKEQTSLMNLFVSEIAV